MSEPDVIDFAYMDLPAPLAGTGHIEVWSFIWGLYPATAEVCEEVADAWHSRTPCVFDFATIRDLMLAGF